MHRPQNVKVKIDLNRVASNLRTLEGLSVGVETARFFMQQAGFNLDPDGSWIGPRDGLQRLNHSEVLGIEPVGF